MKHELKPSDVYQGVQLAAYLHLVECFRAERALDAERVIAERAVRSHITGLRHSDADGSHVYDVSHDVTFREADTYRALCVAHCEAVLRLDLARNTLTMLTGFLPKEDEARICAALGVTPNDT